MNNITISLPFYQYSFEYSSTAHISPDSTKDLTIPLDPVRLDGFIDQVFYSRIEENTVKTKLPHPNDNAWNTSSFHDVKPTQLVIYQSAGAGVSVNTPQKVHVSYYIRDTYGKLTNTFDIRKGWYDLGNPVPNQEHVIDVDIPEDTRIVGVRLTFDVNDDVYEYLDKPFKLKGFEFRVPDNATVLSLFDPANPLA